MALEHDTTQTITKHYFGRSGDLWKWARPLLRRLPIAQAVFDVVGIKLVRQDNSHRLSIPCPACGAVEVSRDGTLPLVHRGGGEINLGDPSRSKPHHIKCLVCQADLDVTSLLEGMKASELDDLLLTGPLKGYLPPQTVFVAAEVGERRNVDYTAARALNPLLPNNFEMTQRLCRVQARSIEQAQSVVAEHHQDMPWKMVEIGRDLEPLSPGWHGGPLNPHEQRVDAEQRHATRIEKRAEIALETIEFQRAREQELGIGR